MNLAAQIWAQKVCERKKRAFVRKSQAVKFARRISGAFGVYKCWKCKKWHLYSKKKPQRSEPDG